MENKKYLAWFINPRNEESFNALFVLHNFLINKICEKFDKVYIINVKNLEFFSKKKKIKY